MNLFKQIENAAIGTQFPINEILAALKWNAEGLIPAIVQNVQNKEVQMMAWMNRDTLLETLTTKQICFWSRSRNAAWRKGETSGHTQRLIEARVDCDGDTLLLLVEQQGPACHTNRPNCFYNKLTITDMTVMTAPAK